MTQNIEAILLDEGIEKTITCGKAHMIAEKYQIAVKDVGDHCIQNDIKITQCMLGCFK